MYVCRNLDSLWFYSTGLSFRPFQNSGLHYKWVLSDLVILPPFAFSYMEFPMITSQKTLFDLGLVWFCMYGIQFPTDPMMDHFLSSVCVRPAGLYSGTQTRSTWWTSWLLSTSCGRLSITGAELTSSNDSQPHWKFLSPSKYLNLIVTLWIPLTREITILFLANQLHHRTRARPSVLNDQRDIFIIHNP